MLKKHTMKFPSFLKKISPRVALLVVVVLAAAGTLIWYLTKGRHKKEGMSIPAGYNLTNRLSFQRVECVRRSDGRVITNYTGPGQSPQARCNEVCATNGGCVATRRRS